MTKISGKIKNNYDDYNGEYMIFSFTKKNNLWMTSEFG